MPPKGLRKKATDVTDTKSNDFEDFCVEEVSEFCQNHGVNGGRILTGIVG